MESPDSCSENEKTQKLSIFLNSYDYSYDKILKVGNSSIKSEIMHIKVDKGDQIQKEFNLQDPSMFDSISTAYCRINKKNIKFEKSMVFKPNFYEKAKRVSEPVRSILKKRDELDLEKRLESDSVGR